MEFSFGTHKWVPRESLFEEPDKEEDRYALGLHAPGLFDKDLHVEKCLLQSEPANRFMACSMGVVMVQSTMSRMETESLDKSLVSPTSCTMQRWNLNPGCSRRIAEFGIKAPPLLRKCFQTRHGSTIAFALDMGDTPNNGAQESLNDEDNTGLGGTRLGRIFRAGGKQLLQKLNTARKNFPMKIFLLLLGFYTANALATILGQTGDWDVLVAGIVVAAIEGIGMLMYKKSMSAVSNNGRLQSFVTMVNFWKAGVCLGLFVDAFKLGS